MTVLKAGKSSRAEKTINLQLAKNKVFRLWLYCHDVTAKYAGLYIYISSYSNYAKHKLTNYYAVPNDKLSVGWNHLVFHYSNAWTDDGSENWGSTMIKMRVKLTAATGQTCSATLGALDYGIVQQSKVVLRFDDASSGVYTKAYPYMQTKGLKGTTYAIPSRVGTPNYCTLTQLQEIYTSGVIEVSNHSYNHVDFTSMSVADITTEITSASDWLVSNGFTNSAYHFAVPNGVDNDNVTAAIAASNLHTSTNSLGTAFWMLNTNQLRIPGYAYLKDATLATVISDIETCLRKNQSYVIMLHDIADSPANDYQWSTANFQGLCDYLVQRKVDVVNMTDFYNGLTNPRKVVVR